MQLSKGFNIAGNVNAYALTLTTRREKRWPLLHYSLETFANQTERKVK